MTKTTGSRPGKWTVAPVDDALRHIEALAALLPDAQRSAHAYARAIDLFSGSDEVRF